MKTDDLISMLSVNVGRVDRREVPRTIGAAVAVSAVASVGAMLLIFGVRSDLGDARTLVFLLLKLVFTTGIVGLSSLYLIRLARPGGERRISIAALAIPFIGIVLLAAVSLAFAPFAHWNRMFAGDQWLECLFSIPAIAIVPFAVIIWAVRRMAPTDLGRTGAVAGLAAGAVSATGYALHCADDLVPFVALWYGGTIALCTIAGATLGSRLLRW
jgi:hypothetical protein